MAIKTPHCFGMVTHQDTPTTTTLTIVLCRVCFISHCFSCCPHMVPPEESLNALETSPVKERSVEKSRTRAKERAGDQQPQPPVPQGLIRNMKEVGLFADLACECANAAVCVVPMTPVAEGQPSRNMALTVLCTLQGEHRHQQKKKFQLFCENCRITMEKSCQCLLRVTRLLFISSPPSRSAAPSSDRSSATVTGWLPRSEPS